MRGFAPAKWSVAEPLISRDGFGEADGSDDVSPKSSTGALDRRILRSLFLPDPRSNVIPIPTLRRFGAARRSRPDRALAVAGQDFSLRVASLVALFNASSNCAAVPSHFSRVATKLQIAVATRSASIVVSTIES